MRKFIKKIVIGINLVIATALLLSYLAVHINPGITVIPSFFGLAYPYILFLNFCFIIFWAVKFDRAIAISFIAIIVGITHFNNYFRFRKTEPGNYDFTLLSYNVRLFDRYEKSGNSKPDIIEMLNREDPAIICLQEFYLDGSQGISSGFTNDLRGDYIVHAKEVGSGGPFFYGIITLSKYPVVNRGDIVHPNSSSLTIYTDLLIDNDTIRIYNNHLQSFRLHRMEKSFLEQVSGMSENEAVDELKKLSVSLKEGFRNRAVQAKRVSDHIKQCRYPVIVCGDFNDTPVSWAYRKVRSGLRDAFVEAGHGAGFTYRDKYPPNRIDYILYDPVIECDAFDVIREKYSDHYPVIGYFRNLK